MIGISFEVAGFACRAAATQNLSSIVGHTDFVDAESVGLSACQALFAAPQSLIVLAPLFVAAGNYLMISRIICTGSTRGRNEHVLLIPARWITPIFVTCDVVTILIQVSGTTISAGSNWVGPTADIGSDILLAGLAIQTLTIAFFITIVLRFGGRRILSIGSKPGHEHLKGLKSTFISSVFIEVGHIPKSSLAPESR